MKKIILDTLTKEAQQSAEKYQLYHNYLYLNHERKKKRLLNVAPKTIKQPEEWLHNRLHNPFYVLKHREKIANSVSAKILKGIYRPEPPFQKDIPKKGGGTRRISVYQLPDSAVSDKFYADLLRKNRHRFSSFSYAYRNDRNVHFAIQDIANELKQAPRLFIAEFDFSKFFDTIEHEYLWKQLNENCFLVSATERSIIEAFLNPGGKGVPQGTSISLFLANVACWRLDRKLEDEGLRFARYADDTIIWTRDYSKICKAFDIITDFSREAGISINYEKSEGISLLQKPEMRSEFQQTKAFVNFLGYKVSASHVSIKDSAVKKIKQQISYLLFKNLIEPLKRRPVQAARFPTPLRDEDFLTAISEIRRYLYGNLTETTLKKFLNGTYVKLNFKGIMSFYPLVNNEEQMRQLDKWLVSTILNALRKRGQLLKALNYSTAFFPFSQTSSDLIKNSKSKAKGLMQIPSFLRIYRALEMGIQNLGIDRVMNPESSYYSE